MGGKLSRPVYLAPHPIGYQSKIILLILLILIYLIVKLINLKHNSSQIQLISLWDCSVNLVTGVGGKLSRPVYLAPWTACPPGDKPTAVGLPPGGQTVPGYLAPHPGYLHPRGASCPGRFILPPANTSKNIYMLFCYFSVSF